jgi:hypothetical protein
MTRGESDERKDDHSGGGGDPIKKRESEIKSGG